MRKSLKPRSPRSSRHSGPIGSAGLYNPITISWLFSPTPQCRLVASRLLLLLLLPYNAVLPVCAAGTCAGHASRPLIKFPSLSENGNLCVDLRSHIYPAHGIPQKCDGTRPVCNQCVKMNRDDECEYDDKKQKSRTQKLKEKLSALEQRLRELESESGGATSPSSSDSSSLGLPPTQHSSPEIAALPSLFDNGSMYGSPSITLSLLDTGNFDADCLGTNFDNFLENSAWSNSSSNSSLYGGASGYGTPEANLLLDTDDLDQTVHPFLEMSPFSSLPSSSEFPYMPRWNPKDPLPYENKKILYVIRSCFL